MSKNARKENGQEVKRETEERRNNMGEKGKKKKFLKE